VRSGGISPLKAKGIKSRLYQGIFKYKHGGNAKQRFSLSQGLILATHEKDTDNELWEKDIKEAVGFSFRILREKLTLYMRLPLCVFP
jgi:hypothetical protein